MTSLEFDEWTRRASPKGVETIFEAAFAAKSIWIDRAGDAEERHHWAPFRGGATCGCDRCRRWAGEAAWLAAAELELLCRIWPLAADDLQSARRRP